MTQIKNSAENDETVSSAVVEPTSTPMKTINFNTDEDYNSNKNHVVGSARFIITEFNELGV